MCVDLMKESFKALSQGELQLCNLVLSHGQLPHTSTLFSEFLLEEGRARTLLNEAAQTYNNLPTQQSYQE